MFAKGDRNCSQCINMKSFNISRDNNVLINLSIVRK